MIRISIIGLILQTRTTWYLYHYYSFFDTYNSDLIDYLLVNNQPSFISLAYIRANIISSSKDVVMQIYINADFYSYLGGPGGYLANNLSTHASH